MVCAPVRSIIPSLKLGDYLSVQAHKPTLSPTCTTIPRYPIFNTRYSVICKVYTGYCGTSEIEHGLCACTVDNPLAKARGLSLRTGAQPMLYLPLGATPKGVTVSSSFIIALHKICGYHNCSMCTSSRQLL